MSATAPSIGRGVTRIDQNQTLNPPHSTRSASTAASFFQSGQSRGSTPAARNRHRSPQRTMLSTSSSSMPPGPAHSGERSNFVDGAPTPSIACSSDLRWPHLTPLALRLMPAQSL